MKKLLMIFATIILLAGFSGNALSAQMEWVSAPELKLLGIREVPVLTEEEILKEIIGRIQKMIDEKNDDLIVTEERKLRVATNDFGIFLCFKKGPYVLQIDSGHENGRYNRVYFVEVVEYTLSGIPSGAWSVRMGPDDKTGLYCKVKNLWLRGKKILQQRVEQEFQKKLRKYKEEAFK